MSNLLDLAARCKSATAPDRELDLEIYLILWPASDIAKLVASPRGLNGQEGYSWDIRGDAVIFERW
ncbi:hypothetical protein CQ12_38070, partial [Bradyrhizobium jicamae]